MFRDKDIDTIFSYLDITPEEVWTANRLKYCDQPPEDECIQWQLLSQNKLYI